MVRIDTFPGNKMTVKNIFKTFQNGWILTQILVFYCLVIVRALLGSQLYTEKMQLRELHFYPRTPFILKCYTNI